MTDFSLSRSASSSAHVAQHTSKGQKTARVVLGVALLALGVITLHSFLPALAWASIFTVALWPSYQRMRRRFSPGRHDIALPLLYTTAVALVFILPLAFIALQLGKETHSILRWLHQTELTGIPLPGWLNKLPLGREQAIGWWEDNLGSPEGTSQLLGRLTPSNIMLYSRNIGAQLTHRAVLFAFTLLTLFFMFRHGDSISLQMRRAATRIFGPQAEELGRQIIDSVHGTLSGLVLVGLGEGVLLGLVYAIVHVPHATLLGAFTAVAAIIPFGAPVAFGLAAILLLSKGLLAAAIAVVVIGFIVLGIADHFIRPALIGGATRLPFLWVLFGILGGAEVWGLLGLFLGPAIMATLIMLWRELADPEATHHAAPHTDAKTTLH